jgi:ribosomal-protein-alanine N-acetyltransferase
MIAQIRSFLDHDFAKLLEIDQICFQPHIAYDVAALRYFLYQIDSHALVLINDSGVVGFGIAATTGSRGNRVEGHIITLDLLPQARGHGHGRELLRHLEENLADDGAATVFLEVDARNSRAIGFYLKMGYRERRRLKNYYGRGRDAIEMTSQL